MTDPCRCSVLEADLEEAERDRDDALRLLGKAYYVLSQVDTYGLAEFGLRQIAERFPELARSDVTR